MSLVFRNVDVSPEDPVEVWPTEAVLTALERGGLGHWRRLTAAINEDPWGPLARRVEEALEVSRPYGVGVVMADVLAAARSRAGRAERAAVAAEITRLQQASGMARAEFASAIGTSVSRLSTYLSGKVTPSAALLVRMRRVATRRASCPDPLGDLVRVGWHCLAMTTAGEHHGGMATGLGGFGPAGEFTVEDLERMPDDGLRYELLDGTLLVSPAPGVWHQEVAGTLYRLLYSACPPELHVVIAPFEWRGSRRTALQPDVLVARRGDLLAVAGGKFLAEPPVLAVEVLSPSTRRIDRLSKLSAYEEAGVASYWLVDPDPGSPSLQALDLVDGCYAEAGCAVGEQKWQAQRPFPIIVAPVDLIVGLRRD